MRVKGCLSAIDGLVVKIRLPNGTKSAITYFCNQDYYALNMKANACPNGEFLDINVGRDGATGDEYASKQSRLWKKCTNDDFKFTDAYYFKIRDAAYSTMPWLIDPYEGSQPLGGKNDVGNYHLQNQGKLLRGLLIR